MGGMRCAQCGKLHDRKRFCSNKCKDRFHNYHNPHRAYAHLQTDPEDWAEKSWEEERLERWWGEGLTRV